MVIGNGKLRISAILSILTGTMLFIGCVFYLILLRNNIENMAKEEAESKSRIILDRNLATHHYFSYTLKPKIFAWTEPFRDKEYFDPTWMSSTYVVRQIDNLFQNLNSNHYYYKECAINARNPQNEADPNERAFLQELQKNPNLSKRQEIRNFEGKPFFVLLRRGEMMEESCLHCHNTPQDAPSEMVRLYGADRSFYREVGDVVSAVSIRIPLSDAYYRANRSIAYLSIAFFLLLLGVYVASGWLYQSLLFKPLERLRQKALQISNDSHRLGEEISASAIPELRDLTASFNQMSHNLRYSMDHLEERVQERTTELSALNDQLQNEIHERRKVEIEREHLIADLQRTLVELNQLSGLLPICSSCKKIRDDKGNWTQIENYIHDRACVEFSHGICPECAKKLYPDYIDNQHTS